MSIQCSGRYFENNQKDIQEQLSNGKEVFKMLPLTKVHSEILKGTRDFIINFYLLKSSLKFKLASFKM